MEKKLEDGGTLQLHVPPDMFAKSVHRSIGCTGCHSDIDAATHPPADKKIQSARSFSLTMTQVCRGCHADQLDKWETSIHAALVRSGDAAAPICTDCHNPHAVIKGAAGTVEESGDRDSLPEVPHGDLHRLPRQRARARPAQFRSERCADLLRLPRRACREAHLGRARRGAGGSLLRLSWRRAGSPPGMASQCGFAFRGGVLSRLPCPRGATQSRSHADRQQRRAAAWDRANRRAAVQCQRPVGRQRDRCAGAVEPAANAQSRRHAGKTVVRGRLDVRTGPQAHELADKSKALSDCKTCHSAGSQAFQSVTISLVGPDGRRVGFGANADVLSSALSLESVSGFYAIGGTRIKLLDILLILAILGGLARSRWALDSGMDFQALLLGPAADPRSRRSARRRRWCEGGMTARER